MPDDWHRSHELVLLLGGRWMLPVLAELTREDRRYRQLQDTIGAISHKMLTETLRRAERDGLIVRTLKSGPVKAETVYQMTDLGHSLGEPVASMAQWIVSNYERVEEARDRWLRESAASRRRSL